MQAGLVRRVLAAAAVVVGSALSVGTLLAQGVQPPAPMQSAQPAAGGAQAPDWLRGRWGDRCGAPQFLELGADFIAEHRGGQVHRTEATFTVTGDVVVIITGRALTQGPEAPPPGFVLVLRRSGDRLRLIGFDDPRQPDRSEPRDTLQRCT